MNFNLKNRPVKATPQEYERWIKGLEKELREKLEDYCRSDIPCEWSRLFHFIKEILGETEEKVSGEKQP